MPTYFFTYRTALLIVGVFASVFTRPLAPAAAQPASMEHATGMYAYVGSFTTAKRKARGDGIHVYRADAATGALTHLQHIADLTNPSFLALSPDQRFLYAVHGDGDYATAFALEAKTGQAKLLNRAATGGSNGVRQAVDPSGKYLIVANYGSGTVAVLAIMPDGSLKDQHQLVPLPGEPGPHRTQQPSSEPHDIVFDPSGKFVLVPDKGLDRIFVFRFDAGTGQLTPAEPDSVKSRPGAGPRHLAFHPKLAIVWVLNELDSTTTTYRWDGQRGVLTPLQVITTLPTEFTGYSTAAEIAVSADGRTVYCSNRGHDSVAIFSADATSGLLTPIGWQATQGASPRFVGLDPSGRFLHAANENGDTIVTFAVDAATGKLTPTGQVIKTGSPVTIVFTGKP
ncbi:MAG TPA: lactonase family protein [Hyphomicrobiaceae bacterium]|nr:lactonase family protein [Hyphomicrobiaceae bacterium]